MWRQWKRKAKEDKERKKKVADTGALGVTERKKIIKKKKVNGEGGKHIREGCDLWKLGLGGARIYLPQWPSKEVVCYEKEEIMELANWVQKKKKKKIKS